MRALGNTGPLEKNMVHPRLCPLRATLSHGPPLTSLLQSEREEIIKKKKKVSSRSCQQSLMSLQLTWRQSRVLLFAPGIVAFRTTQLCRMNICLVSELEDQLIFDNHKTNYLNCNLPLGSACFFLAFL